MKRALKSSAAMRYDSLVPELRGLLAQAAKPGPTERLALAHEIRAMTPRKRQNNSTALVREDRER